MNIGLFTKLSQECFSDVCGDDDVDDANLMRDSLHCEKINICVTYSKHANLSYNNISIS